MSASSRRRLRVRAYDDRALPIGEGQTISQPLIVALMTEALALRPEDRVLDIGTGSGYQAAVLSRLVREVVTVERIDALLRACEAVLADRWVRERRMRTSPVTRWAGRRARRTTRSSSRRARRTSRVR